MWWVSRYPGACVYSGTPTPCPTHRLFWHRPRTRYMRIWRVSLYLFIFSGTPTPCPTRRLCWHRPEPATREGGEILGTQELVSSQELQRPVPHVVSVGTAQNPSVTRECGKLLGTQEFVPFQELQRPVPRKHIAVQVFRDAPTPSRATYSGAYDLLWEK